MNKQTKKSFLFYLVHPAKFHFHKVQINELRARGHKVDVVINTKDILEELVKEEGWNYTNIFPESRKINHVHVYIGAGVSLIKSIYRLWKYTKGKKYDLFVGDALVYLGRIKGVSSLYPTDDELEAVPEDRTWFIPANYIIAPQITGVGKWINKKIAYKGYKALAYLHPNHYKPDRTKLGKELQKETPFFLIRCTGFTATHDLNKTGISDDILFRLIGLLELYGKVLITSERRLPKELERYQLNIKKNDIFHYINYAKLFISDSTTMSTEAAVLGTPSIEFDEYFYEIKQMIELEEKYGLIHCFRTYEKKEFFQKIQDLAKIDDLKTIYQKRRDVLLKDMIDVSGFLVWLYENYPYSVNEYWKNPNIQNKFK